MNNVICQAIQEKRLLDFTYEGHHRVVEPHAYGVNTKDHNALRCYQVGGSSDSHKQPYWRLFLESEIRGLTMLPQQFANARQGYKRNDKDLERIFCQL